MSTNLTQDAAKAFFAEIHPKLLKAWMDAWELHIKQYNHPFFKSSCRSHIIQNLAFGIAQGMLCTEGSGVRKLETQNQQLLIFGQTAIVGFKKLNGEALTTNSYRTTRNKKFMRQQPLPDLGETPRLICGLKIAEGWTDVIGCYLVQPKHESDCNWGLNLSMGCTELDTEQEKIQYEDNEQFFTPPAAKRASRKANNQS